MKRCIVLSLFFLLLAPHIVRAIDPQQAINNFFEYLKKNNKSVDAYVLIKALGNLPKETGDPANVRDIINAACKDNFEEALRKLPEMRTPWDFARDFWNERGGFNLFDSDKQINVVVPSGIECGGAEIPVLSAKPSKIPAVESTKASDAQSRTVGGVVLSDADAKVINDLIDYLMQQHKAGARWAQGQLYSLLVFLGKVPGFQGKSPDPEALREAIDWEKNKGLHYAARNLRTSDYYGTGFRSGEIDKAAQKFFASRGGVSVNPEERPGHYVPTVPTSTLEPTQAIPVRELTPVVAEPKTPEKMPTKVEPEPSVIELTSGEASKINHLFDWYTLKYSQSSQAVYKNAVYKLLAFLGRIPGRKADPAALKKIAALFDYGFDYVLVRIDPSPDQVVLWKNYEKEADEFFAQRGAVSVKQSEKAVAHMRFEPSAQAMQVSVDPKNLVDLENQLSALNLSRAKTIV